MKKKKRKFRKTRPYYMLEYALVRPVMFIAEVLPLKAARAISHMLGLALYALSSKRRGLALGNLHAALGHELSGDEIRRIARRSCASFILTFLEIMKFRPILRDPEAVKRADFTRPEIFEIFNRCKKTHDESGGCIFVTPHLGNWELLPHVSAAVGIDLVVVARPPDNPYLRKLLLEDRESSGQVIIPKKNALYVLKKALRSGKSLGLLPDQATSHGLSVDFFGRKALTTPIPALLAITYKRPIVVVACLRRSDGKGFDGFVSDPIWPNPDINEKDELFNMTARMNAEMQSVIKQYPEQYLWIHNRWKTYAGVKNFLQGAR